MVRILAIHRIQGCGRRWRHPWQAPPQDRLVPSSASLGGDPSDRRSKGCPLTTMVAPCSPPSRTLRAGFAGAASGILDGVCARRSAARQVGTKGWSLAAEQRDGAHSRGSRARRKKEEKSRVATSCLTKKAPYKVGASVTAFSLSEICACLTKRPISTTWKLAVEAAADVER